MAKWLFSLLIYINSVIFSVAIADHDYQKHSINAHGGMYSFTSPSSSLTGIGSMDIGYAYRFLPNWAGHISLNNIVSTQLVSLIWGMDIGAHYCLFNCYATLEKIDQVIEIAEYKKWGMEVGLGMTQRSFQLVSSSVSYSGPFVRLEGLYFIDEKFKYVGRIQYSKLASSTRTLDIRTVSFGIAMDF